jgi:pseudouridine-5'-phosphate glycosidase
VAGTNDFPAFFSPTSGLRAPARLDSPVLVAKHFAASRQLALQAGTLLAIPNPNPAAAAEVEAAIHGKRRHEPMTYEIRRRLVAVTMDNDLF